jgi:hypothetical protein
VPTVAVRDVSDVVRILNEVNAQLGELSGSELRTLNTSLLHAHDHVAKELNRRSGLDAQQE